MTPPPAKQQPTVIAPPNPRRQQQGRHDAIRVLRGKANRTAAEDRQLLEAVADEILGAPDA